MDKKTLITFTCSTINPEFLFDQKNPELYVSLDPKGNNLEADLPKLQKLYLNQNKLQKTRIIILIGNTDPFYIYSQEGKIFPNTSEDEFFEKFNKRWVIYKKNLNRFIKKTYPSLKFELISWYELEKYWEKEASWDFRKQFQKTLREIDELFSAKDFDWELNSLSQAFGKGKYFYNIKKPPVKILKEWVRRKFAEYAVQGMWIKQIFPDAVLIQNEKPSILRTRMYQPLIKKYLNSQLPVIYPYGIDNKGYQ